MSLFGLPHLLKGILLFLQAGEKISSSLASEKASIHCKLSLKCHNDCQFKFLIARLVIGGKLTTIFRISSREILVELECGVTYLV